MSEWIEVENNLPPSMTVVLGWVPHVIDKIDYGSFRDVYYRDEIGFLGWSDEAEDYVNLLEVSHWVHIIPPVMRKLKRDKE